MHCARARMGGEKGKFLPVALFCLALVACATAEEPGAGGFLTDQPRGGGGAMDRGVLGDECDTDRDCASQLCVFDPEIDEVYCSRWCEEECVESGWTCTEIRDGGELRGACLREIGGEATSGSDGSGRPSGASTAGTRPPATDSPSPTERPSDSARPTPSPSDSRPTDERTTPPLSSGSSCEPICTPNEPETDTRSCGDCGEGVESRTRTCTTDGCFWGDWGDWGSCQTDATCSPGQSQTLPEDCGPCGATRSRTRSCNASTCEWGEWGDWTSCPSRTCSPGDSTECDPADSCGHRVCSATCEWGACEPGPEPQNVCLRVRPGSTTDGSNYRCCGTGQWEYCFSNCDWTGNCQACTAAQCPQCH